VNKIMPARKSMANVELAKIVIPIAILPSALAGL
jgi:hypothetical protein